MSISQAEYEGLINGAKVYPNIASSASCVRRSPRDDGYRWHAGLEEAYDQGIRRLEVKGDSELVINQMIGTYRVNSVRLLFAACTFLYYIRPS